MQQKLGLCRDTYKYRTVYITEHERLITNDQMSNLRQEGEEKEEKTLGNIFIKQKEDDE